MLLTLISPAKTMAWRPIPPGLSCTQPIFLEQAGVLAAILQRLTTGEIRQLMALSVGLGASAWQNFQNYSPPFTPENSRPAALLYRGDTYVGLDADSLTPADWAYAQERLWIISGLYGLLRPLDLIQPYRLEMGAPLANPQGKNLYPFWREPLTHLVNKLADHGATVVNLASVEYAKAVVGPALTGRLITPLFQEIRHGKPQTIGLLAKRARGQMARFIIRQRMEEATGLQNFSENGYRYDASTSTPTQWIFSRAG